jgi:hypothetical protein
MAPKIATPPAQTSQTLDPSPMGSPKPTLPSAK